MTSRIEFKKPAADFHVHLRDGDMMELVTPTVREGGVSVAYVMPNLVPPLVSIDEVLEYKKKLENISPSVTFLMTLYLRPEITPDVIRAAKRTGCIYGVKCYPAGVTTNSTHGVSSYEQYYPTFQAMQEEDMVLNLHGECPSSNEGDIHVLNAEEKFLPLLQKLHSQFPRLRIVLEHVTSAQAVEIVKRCSDTVSATITAHHLYLTVDSWGGNSMNFCKPVAKFPKDRQALIDAAMSGNPRFFFGSDSAPHPLTAKSNHKNAPAGVFTQPFALSYLAEIFDQHGKLDRLEDFASTFGRRFYGLDDENPDHVYIDKNDDLKKLVLVKQPFRVPETIHKNNLKVVPFKASDTLSWAVTWQ